MEMKNIESKKNFTPNDVNDYVKLRKLFYSKAREVFDFFVENCSDYIHDKEDISEPSFRHFRLDEKWFIISYDDDCDPYNSETDIEILTKYMYDETWKEYLLKTYK